MSFLELVVNSMHIEVGLLFQTPYGSAKGLGRSLGEEKFSARAGGGERQQEGELTQNSFVFVFSFFLSLTA